LILLSTTMDRRSSPMPETRTARQPMPAGDNDPRVEQLTDWLRDQPDAPGLLEAAARAIGFDALLLPQRTDPQQRIHRLGGALIYEIGRIPDACLGRQPTCTAAAIREIEAAVVALRGVHQPADSTDRHPMADFAEFTHVADKVVALLAIAERDPRQRAVLVVRARELMADLQEGLLKVEDADPEWTGWAGIDPPRGSVFERDERAST